MLTLKNGDMTFVLEFDDWKPAASAEMAQHTRYATCGASDSDFVSTAMIGGSVSGVTMGGSMSDECMNSKMRPIVHAVVSWGQWRCTAEVRWEHDRACTNVTSAVGAM